VIGEQIDFLALVAGRILHDDENLSPNLQARICKFILSILSVGLGQHVNNLLVIDQKSKSKEIFKLRSAMISGCTF